MDLNEDRTWESDRIELSVYAQARSGSAYDLLLSWLEPFLPNTSSEMVGYLRPNDQWAHSYLIYTSNGKFRVFCAIPPEMDGDGDPTVRGEVVEVDFRNNFCTKKDDECPATT